MKHGLLFLTLFFVQNAFALYGAKVEVSNDGYVVSLHNNGKNFCNGVLITPTKVLTAGHCIDIQGQEEFGNSHGLIYEPEKLIVTVGGVNIRARAVTLSQSYFEGLGLDAEDLALIELSAPVKNVKPISLARKVDLVNQTKITLITRNKKVSGVLSLAKSYGPVTALFIDKASGACLGDSGGAVVINKNGESKLAGILMYSGEETCMKKTGYAYFPKVQF
jgi:secreted trypsin-like serine protease